MEYMIDTDTILYVLSLEDSIPDFEMINYQLTNAGYHLLITHVEKESDFVASIRNNQYDIILADFNLPGFDAFGALRLCSEICPATPFICVSGSIGEETAIELLKLGAVDYVIKDRPERLPFAVQRALDEAKDKMIRKKAEEALTAKMKELERFHKLTVGRELAMVELKKEVNELLKKSGQEEKYVIV